METRPALARTMGFWAVVIYGVGDMLGAGIYGLVGRSAALLGTGVWMGFAGAMVAALLTGLSYASIASRYPRAAGAAYVAQRAFGWSGLSYVLGLAVAFSGLTSMATGSRVIAGYLQTLGIAAPTTVLAVGFLVLLAGVVFRGIRESTWMNAVCTSVELLGILIVIGVGIPYWGSVDYFELPPVEGGRNEGAVALLLLQGAVLSFFSFIGFEDLLNVSEEVKDPERTLPRALVTALAIATVLYMAVAISAVSVLPPATLGASKAALVDVVRAAAPWFPPALFTGIGIFAVANTALLNFIMGSRLLYGMSRQGLLPGFMGAVHAGRRTPHVAILVLLSVVVTLMLIGNIDQLAAATSLLLLSAFVVVNLGLFRLQGRAGEPKGAFEVPRVVPVLGALVCGALIVARVLDPAADPAAPRMVALIVLGLTAMHLVMRPKAIPEV